MRRLIPLLLLLFLVPAVLPAAKSSKSSAQKTVKVRKYTKKDGTVVQAHARSAPHAKSQKSTARAPQAKPPSAKKPKAFCTSCARDSHHRIKRSPAVRADFMRTHPCPSTGRTKGACPGYVIDHIVPLKRGGADVPGNMQWQTAAAAKAKDKVE